jgi:hypothetical protein
MVMLRKNISKRQPCVFSRYAPGKTFTVRTAIKISLLQALVFFVSLLGSSSQSAMAEQADLELTKNNIPPAFSASYQLEKGLLQVGVLEVTLKTTSDDEWIYESNTRATGVAKVFLGEKPVVDRSVLAVLDDLILPISFEHIQKQGSKDRSQFVSFNWPQHTAQAKYKEKDNSIPLQKNMFDNFSVQLLLMANIDQLPDIFTLPVISKAKQKPFKFYKIGNVPLTTSLGVIDTLLIERRKDNDKNSTYKIWAAADAFGLPVQIEKTENGKSQYLAKIISSDLLKK